MITLNHLFSVLLAIVTGFLATGWAAVPEVTFSCTYFSRYVSEGRDDLTEGGLISTEVIVAWEDFEVGVVFADAWEDEFAEFEVGIGYGREIGPVSLGIGYALIDDLYGGPDDREVSAEARIALPFGFEASVGATTSLLVDGSVVALAIARPLAWFKERVRLVPSVVQIFDFGFASDDYDGPSNLEVALAATVTLTEGWDGVLSVHHSFAQEDVEQDGGGDLSWFTLGLSSAY